MSNEPTDASGIIEAVLEKYADELVDLRRDLHAHPELSWSREAHHRASWPTGSTEAGLAGHALIDGTGLIAEVGDQRPGRRAARRPRRAARRRHHRRALGQPHARRRARLRARRAHRRPGRRRARARRGPRRAACCRGRVRLLFQPAEEVMPGGALELIEAGALDDVDRIFGLHCDPTLDVGQVGLREGPITGAADAPRRPADGPRRAHLASAPDRGPHLRPRQGGHRAARDPVPPARPARRASAWSGASVRAGSAHNVIPGAGQVAGTVRMLDAVAWADAETLVRAADRPDRRAVRRDARRRLQARRAAGGQRAACPRAARPAPSSGCSAATGWSRPPRASAARTSAGTSTGCRARWPGSAPARRAGRRTTCTRATCASTSARSAIGARVLRRGGRRAPCVTGR